MIDFRELIKAGSHFGHQTSRWCPKMEQYIWGLKNKIHLIDVSKTAFQVEKSAKFLEEVAAEGKTILWLGTKRPAQKVIGEVATRLDMPYVNHRWIGGTLSNYAQVKKSVTKLLHYEDILARSEKFPYYTKKELNVFQKMVNRLKKSIGGIRGLTWPVGALVVVDVGKERSAVQEAAVMGVPIVSIVDTNGDPSLVDYVIPANDDAPRSIQVILDYLALAVDRGKVRAETKPKAEEAQKPAEKKVKEGSEKEVKKTVAATKPAAEKKEPEKKVVKKAEEKKEAKPSVEPTTKEAPAKTASAPKAKKTTGESK